MIRVWRLCRARRGAFHGEGARLYGGRWNLRGTPVVYASATASPAALEHFVNLDVDEAPRDLVLVSAHVPKGVSVEVIKIEDLPNDWRSTPAPEALARIGTDWAHARRTAVLSTPSAVVPPERNDL